MKSIGPLASKTLSPVLLACAAALGASCREPTLVLRPPPELRIENRKEVEIAIRQKACGTPDEAFHDMSRVAPGGVLAVPLAPACVDLVAIGPGGEVVGQQNQLRMMPGAVWRIQ
jgi:hypothetical protein